MVGNENEYDNRLELAHPGVAGLMGWALSPSLDLIEEGFDEFGKHVPKDSVWQGVLPDNLSGLGTIGKGAGPLFELAARSQDGVSTDDLLAVTGGFIAGEVVRVRAH